MLTITNENYLLSPILDHKEKYDLGGIEIQIVKNYENNLRSRNCQLGIVEAMPENNPLKLNLGDIVFVNHFTFHGDIGANRSFTFRPHIEYEGKKIFRAPISNIYFKYNNETIEALGKNVIVEQMYSDNITESGIHIDSTQFKDRGRIIYAVDDTLVGKEVLVEKNALYPLELKGVDICKVNENDIVAEINGEELIPFKNRVVLEDEEDIQSKCGLDLSLVKQSNTVKSKVISVGKLPKGSNFIKEGDTVLRYRNYGIRDKNRVVVSILDDNIHGVIL